MKLCRPWPCVAASWVVVSCGVLLLTGCGEPAGSVEGLAGRIAFDRVAYVVDVDQVRSVGPGGAAAVPLVLQGLPFLELGRFGETFALEELRRYASSGREYLMVFSTSPEVMQRRVLGEGMEPLGEGVFGPGRATDDTVRRLFPAIGIQELGEDTLVAVSADGEAGVRVLLSGDAAPGGRVALLLGALPEVAIRLVFPPGGACQPVALGQAGEGNHGATVLLPPPDGLAARETTVEDLRIDPLLGELDSVAAVDVSTEEALLAVRIVPDDGRIIANDVLSRYGLLEYCA